ncbi:hypothetical protein [Pyrodictium occultum]|uniref:hypothetical protein n=1 Tax=Pyrodictium occultum TaxID=2309 RepID=UPI0022A98B9A|nr:hypothetical protein [Pyrodictium occultum]
MDAARIVNPGSVGQPRDGIAAAGYALLDTETGEVRLGRVRYDAGRVLKALESLGVPEPYMGPSGRSSQRPGCRLNRRTCSLQLPPVSRFSLPLHFV